MTFRELAARIATMTEGQLDSVAYFVESYDEPACTPIDVHVSDDDTVIPDDPDDDDSGETIIPAGIPYLC